MKQDVFGHVVETPKGVKLVGYKWIFARKHNENNEIIRYKVRLVVSHRDLVLTTRENIFSCHGHNHFPLSNMLDSL